MWFLDQIVSWLHSARDYFYDAYETVSSWVWPFYLLSYPLYSLYRVFFNLAIYFGEFNSWVDYVAGRVANILTFSNIYSYFKTYFDAAINAWNWVANAFWNVWSVVDSWWTTTQYTVLAWIDEARNWATTLFNQASLLLASLQAAWDNFKGMIPTIDDVIYWWNNWTGNVLLTVNTWWTGALLEVSALINSAFIERESWWAGWSNFRDQVALFFADPLEFLWDRAADWFLGPEE